MIATNETLPEIVAKLLQDAELGIDAETTGLLESDRLFAISIAGGMDAYFNFNNAPDIPLEHVLDRDWFIRCTAPLFGSIKTWYIQNAKFDLRMLAKFGVTLTGPVVCTYAMERLVQNNYFGDDAYRLSGLAKRRGLEKDERVEEYISKNGLYTTQRMPGKKKIIRVPHFDKVPFGVMEPYAVQDARLHLQIGRDQRATLEKLSSDARFPSLLPLVKNEIELTKTCFTMERRGIRINRPLCGEALEYEISSCESAKKQFQESTGREYEDSRALFRELFDAAGEKYPLTEKGNASFASDVLEEMSSPIAGLINKVRYHEKRANTYYSSFLHYAYGDVIHPDMRQAGTETGRFSYRDPNLQNVPKEEDESIPYHVRQCFIPRQKNRFFSLDYAQMEYRLMLDMVGEHKLIKQINEGADVHQATADLCRISRTQAKTLNFAVLYGAGATKIAKSLSCTEREAYNLLCDYFANLPKVKPMLTAIRKQGEARGFVFNWFGRRCHIAQKDWSYILPNHLVQGGCADIVKVAMNRIAAITSTMILQVHDELLFELPIGWEDIIPKVKNIMETVYPAQNGMRMDVSCKMSATSWAEKDLQAWTL